MLPLVTLQRLKTNKSWRRILKQSIVKSFGSRAIQFDDLVIASTVSVPLSQQQVADHMVVEQCRRLPLEYMIREKMAAKQMVAPSL